MDKFVSKKNCSCEETMEPSERELELSDSQLERIDEVENAVYELCKILTEDSDIEWSMSYIGEIADLASNVLASNGHKVRYPSIVIEPDGRQHIEDYVTP